MKAAPKEITLAELAEAEGNAGAARALGCTPAAIAYALAEDRKIMVKVARNGACTAYEIKPFPGRALVSPKRKTAAQQEEHAA